MAAASILYLAELINTPRSWALNLTLLVLIPEVCFFSHPSLHPTNKRSVGVGRTTPTVSWFESEIERSLWESTGGRELIETYEDVARVWSRSQVMGKVAEERNLEAITHLRTENVAHDMLKITEAHGFEKLQYWGFS